MSDDYTARQREYIDALGVDAHATAVEIIGALEAEVERLRGEHKAAVALATAADAMFQDDGRAVQMLDMGRAAAFHDALAACREATKKGGSDAK